MAILLNVARAAIAGIIVVVVAEVSRRYPRLGAVLLTLPLVSVMAFLASWFQHHDLPAVSKLARETLVLVPLGLPFFVPLAFAEKLGWGFWPSFWAGIALATTTVLAWVAWGPKLS